MVSITPDDINAVRDAAIRVLTTIHFILDLAYSSRYREGKPRWYGGMESLIDKTALIDNELKDLVSRLAPPGLVDCLRRANPQVATIGQFSGQCFAEVVRDLAECMHVHFLRTSHVGDASRPKGDDPLSIESGGLRRNWEPLVYSLLTDYPAPECCATAMESLAKEAMRANDDCARQNTPEADGPCQPDTWRHNGVVLDEYEGMRKGSWKLANFLWGQDNNTAHFDAIGKPVYGAPTKICDASEIGSLRRDANTFFKTHEIPWKVAIVGEFVRLSPAQW